jgi:hypothetical protein
MANKTVLLQVLKSWSEGGITQQVGARLSVSASRAPAMINLGYARRVEPGEAFDYPAEDSKHSFQEITIDEPEPVIDNSPVVVEEKDEVVFTGEVETKIPQLESIEFLKSNHVYALKRAGIYRLADLNGMTIEQLYAINGIGTGTADKLFELYNQLLNDGYHKESDMEIMDK